MIFILMPMGMAFKKTMGPCIKPVGYINNINNIDLSVNTNLSGDWSVWGLYDGESTSINIENSDLQDYTVTQGINPNILDLDQAEDYSKLEEFNLIVGFHNSEFLCNIFNNWPYLF